MSMAISEDGSAFEWFLRRGIADQNNDPRTGSSRDGANSTSGLCLSRCVPSKSYAALFSAVAPIAAYAAVCLLIFWSLRPRFYRVYAPRSILSSLEPHERTPKLPSTWFTWVKDFYKIPDMEVLNRSSLEGYLFLRFLKLLCVICLFGCLITWPILLPLHYHGGHGSLELDRLTFGNVSNIKWLYAHALLAWVFFGFVLFMVTRECIYFINLRNAYLLSPYYANRLSSRTVLFSCVPDEVLDERKIRRIFGDSVKNVWIPRETDDLDQLVEERDQTAFRLEKAELLLIKKVNIEYQKAVKAGHPEITAYPALPPESYLEDLKKPGGAEVTVSSQLSSPISPPTSSEQFPRDATPIMNTNNGAWGTIPDVNGSVAALWIPASQRPSHRPLANYGRSVDTIKWTRNRLKELAPKIAKLRKRYRKGIETPIPAIFVEFHTQVDAQSAFQTLAHHSANRMRAEIVGVRPQEIIWPSLYMGWRERIIRRFLVQALVASMVIFWAIPSAFIAGISNVDKLTETLPFLKWIKLLPEVVLGLISGLAPVIALSMLMAIVPTIMRFCARQAGIVTKSRVELFVQHSYFVFQVVQVFLVTTIASAAVKALESIVKDPLSARNLLAEGIPAASNFYISYFVLQGLAMSATRIVHLGGLIRHQLMANAGGNPRITASRYHRLRRIHWGGVYPIFTNMGLIAIAYSLIAPVVLGVALLGLYLIYLSYRYNILYVYSCERDTRGLHYPRALKHILVGLYVAEVCMLGLFGLKGAYIPLVLMVALIIFTALVHFSLNDALSPLLYNIPRTLAAEEELRKAGNHPWNARNLIDKNDTIDTQEAAESQEVGYDSDFDPSDPTDNAISHTEQHSRAVEGAPALLDLGNVTMTSFIRKRYESSGIPSIISAIDFWSYWISPNPNQNPNFIIKFLHPAIFADYHILRSQIPEEIANIEIKYSESVLKDAYNPPSMRNKSPRIWIPKDVAGVSRQEVAHSGKVIEVSDGDAWIDERNMVEVDWDGETETWVLRDWERVKF